jgi:hypothetical protein
MSESEPQVRRVDTWPGCTHACTSKETGDSVLNTVFFRGACKDGVEVTCPRCGIVFLYVKPTAAAPIHGQESGGRTHF